MTWARLDDGFHAHPKVKRLSLAAVGLFAKCLSYAAHYETNGELDAETVREYSRGNGGRKALRELVEGGMFEERDDTYSIHDYLDFNPSRAELEDGRRQSRERQTRARARGRQAVLPWDGEGSTDAERHAATHATPTQPGPTRTQEDPPVGPPKGGNDLASLWAKLNDPVAAMLGTAGQLEPVALDDDTLSVRAITPGAAGWIDERHRTALEQIVSDARGEPTRVHVVNAPEPVVPRRRGRRAA